MNKYFNLLFVFLLTSCKTDSDALFQKLSVTESGIHFENRITETDELNVLVYEYFYNGGGVAAADFDNDGLIDLYFTAKSGSDKIYKNTGNLNFEDQSTTANLGWNGEWKTGVTVVDINNDGLQDIYVSVSGNEENPELRKNKLYINQGNFQFKEEAAKYGLDQDGYTTQSAFFDYDKDGDLDAYIMNHNVKDFKRFDVEAIHFMRDEYAGDRLFRNDSGHFIDVSQEAGISGTPIGFGLGLHIADLNNDHWPDIYVSNDYLEGDYLYVNNQDGTFTDQIKEMVDHTSYFSMGNDVADVNNDALPDIFTSDMLPEDNHRQKLLFGPDKYEGYLSMLRNGFHPEMMRNMLHINEGNGKYAEVGQLAGVSNTDWSWSPLIADFDNDGLKDLFISNGYLRDYTNNDFVKFYAEQRSESQDNVLEIINQMPSSEVSNYVFKNNDGLTFTNAQKAWGFEETGITNGAIYADLDNDGDLEIITNNINEPAAVFENKSMNSHFIGINLAGRAVDILNTKVKVWAAGQTQYREFSPNHGFQSAYMGPLHFGIGSHTAVDKIELIYPNGQTQTIHNPAVDTYHKLDYLPNGTLDETKPETLLEELIFQDIVHGQAPINDFNRQLLLPWMYSYQGPCIAKADINGDGIEDFFMGGGKGSPGHLMKGLANGKYDETNLELMKKWELCTDVDARFFDADNDGDQDLYVVGGGYEYLPNDIMLQNRLYLNDGKGNFTKTNAAFPADLFSDSSVEILDFDNDGDQDVFVAGFVLPGDYPSYNPSRLYENKEGKFTKIENELFTKLGLIKEVIATDYNADGRIDLLLAGEWTSIQLLKNTSQGFVLDTESINTVNGLWQSLLLEDFDGDGDPDLIAGNLGLNTQFSASGEEPMQLHLADFDGNGRKDPLLSCYIQGENYPIYSRDELLAHIVPLKAKYITYASYADVTMESLLDNFKEVKPQVLKATELSTVYFENQNGKFVQKTLPQEIQAAPIYALLAVDVNKDGFKDLIAAGNNTHTRVRIGNISANHGQVFINDSKGNFSYLPQGQTGLDLKGEIRALEMVNNKLLAAENGWIIRAFKIKNTL